MKEFKTIVDAYNKVDFSQRKAAVATVVRVRGSSYRSPGARMLITDDGRWVGSISGGCLEGDALRKARQVMTSGVPITVTYDTREESNQNLGIGLGCNGVIDVLIERVDPRDDNNPMKFFESMLRMNAPVALATIFATNGSTVALASKMLVTPDGTHVHTVADAALQQAIGDDLEKMFDTRKSEAKSYRIEDRTTDVFIELIQPAISLIVFGGGFDARPVTQLAKALGWGVMVTDECVAHIAPAFFPDADKLSRCQRDFVDREIHVTPYTACILMSHNYDYDRDVLKKLLPTATPYIGILGPRKRFDKMLKEFEAQHIAVTANDLHRIHAPAGLDIGAETPDEIAFSILSEIQAKFTNRSGGFLKYRNAPIHHRDMASDQVFKQVFLNTDGDNKQAHG